MLRVLSRGEMLFALSWHMTHLLNKSRTSQLSSIQVKVKVRKTSSTY